MRDYYTENKSQIMLSNGIEFFLQPTEKEKVATRAHIHDSIELLFVTDGSFYVNLSGREFDVGVGDLVFIRAGCIHTLFAKSEEKNAYYVLKIDQSLLFALFPEEKAGKYALHMTLQSEGARLFWRAAELERLGVKDTFLKLARETQNPGAAYELCIRAGAFSIISALISDMETQIGIDSALSSPVYEQIYRSTVYINRHFAEDIDAMKMSRVLGISYSYFSRMFVKITGTSFRKYLNAVRIRAAEQMLLCAGTTVTGVAAKCGYNNVSHFIATYRSIKGTTPYKMKKDGAP